MTQIRQATFHIIICKFFFRMRSKVSMEHFRLSQYSPTPTKWTANHCNLMISLTRGSRQRRKHTEKKIFRILHTRIPVSPCQLYQFYMYYSSINRNLFSRGQCAFPSVSIAGTLVGSFFAFILKLPKGDRTSFRCLLLISCRNSEMISPPFPAH